MALQTKDFSVSGKSDRGTITYTYILRVTENSVNTAKNTSNVTVQAILKQNYSGLAFKDWTTNITCYLNNVLVINDSRKRKLEGTSEHIYATWTGDLSHDSNGKLTLEVDGQLWQNNPEDFNPPTLTIKDKTMTLTDLATECGAPTYFTVSPDPFEWYVKFQWGGATDGRYNSIKSYSIQCAVSSDNGNTWTSDKTVWTDSREEGNTSVSLTLDWLSNHHSINPKRGDLIRFSIRANGTAGLNSYWVTKEVRMNSLPSSPSISLIGDKAYKDSIKLRFSEVNDPDGNFECYVLQRYISAQSVEDIVWETIYEGSDREFTDSLDVPSGTEVQYQVCAKDSLGAKSSYYGIAVIIDIRPVYVHTGIEIKPGILYKHDGTSWRKAEVHLNVGEMIQTSIDREVLVINSLPGALNTTVQGDVLVINTNSRVVEAKIQDDVLVIKSK